MKLPGCRHNVGLSPIRSTATRSRQLAKPSTEEDVIKSASFRLVLVDSDPVIRKTAKKAIMKRGIPWSLQLHADYLSFLRSLKHLVRGKETNVKKMDLPVAVFLATSIGGCSCLQSLRKISTLVPSLPIFLLGVTTEPKKILQFVVSGARGFLLKPVRLPELLHALNRAEKGWPAFSQQAESALLEALARRGRSRSAYLTHRQKEIIALFFRGLSYKEISSALGIAIGSVHAHLSTIYKRLGAHNREEAIDRFLRQVSSNDETFCE